MSDAADDEFVEEHEPLVRKLALRLKAQLELTTDVDDLMAYGYRGLVEARTRFDPSRGVQFNTFAYYRVRGAILDGVRQMAYLPRKVHARRKAAEAADRAAQQVGARRGADPDRRADAGAALDGIDEILSKTCAAYVIAAVGQSDDRAGPGPEAQAVAKQEHARVREALDVLPERERALVEGHFFEDRTLEEIGQEMGISKSWASRLCSRALGRMRAALEET
ncbi:MAG TPA: sigma-70 family RNA polymerase sigma factor [Sandaracinaceae bacterium LLY-WYZ-13_1]|nr:sigma-70 family RNA polymerase sigma factor [Sandaracinaceae bacterium LLY-WYZ-13_1]